MYASREGVGNLIGAWGQAFQLLQLKASIIVVAGLAIIFNEGVRFLERRCEHWRT